jgi:hypothetical protein
MESKKKSELSKRFLIAIDALGKTGYQISKDVPEISNSTLTHIRNGRNEPSKSIIEAFLSHFSEVNKVWLLTGEGEMLKSQQIGNVSGSARAIQQSVNGYIGGNVEAHNHNDEGKDMMIKKSNEQMDDIIHLLYKEFHEFHEEIKQKDKDLEKVVTESYHRNERNTARIDALSNQLIAITQKVQAQSDKLLEILEKKL